MAYTVYRPGGVSDNLFQEYYARLLRQTGHDLGKLPRVPDPATGQRWLHAWDSRADAQQFADTLQERTGGPPWEVVEVPGPVSEGPLGPILIQFVRLGTGITFELHSLSRGLLRSAYPRLVPPIYQAKVDWEGLEEYKRVRGSFADLVHQLAPAITDLDPAQLRELGYAAADCDRDESVVYVPPHMPGQPGGAVGPADEGAPLAGTLAEIG